MTNVTDLPAGADTRVFAGAAPFSPDAPVEHRGGLYRWQAGQGGWDELTVGLPERPAVRAVAVHPADRDVVFAGTQDGPYRSTDGGDSWERLDFPRPGLPVWSLTFDPSDHRVVYCGTGPAAVFRSDDSGEHWERLANAALPERVDMGFPSRLIDLAVDPTDSNVLYAGVEVGGVLRSGDGGASWSDCTPHLVELAAIDRYRSRIGSDTDIEGMLDVHALALSPAAPDVAFLALRMGVFRTDDHGATWTDIEVGRFSPLTYSRDVKVSPHDPRVLYAALSPAAISRDGSLWRSDDLGETWRRFDKVSPRSTLMRIAPHPRNPAQVWAATREGEVFATADEGATWQALPLPTGGRDIYALACG